MILKLPVTIRSLLRLSTLSVLLLTISCSSTKTGARRPIELFNGRDLRGWRYVLADPKMKMQDVWSVENGILTCKGTPIGAIYRGPAVTNFQLVVEYRWAPGSKPGNSGIFSRISAPMKPIPRAVELQLMHGSAGDVMGLQGRKVASGQPRFFEVKAHPQAGDIAGVKKEMDRERPAGEWNRVEIYANGPRYSVLINGKFANDAQGIEELAGPVGLQSEGGVIQFRRVTLTPLD